MSLTKGEEILGMSDDDFAKLVPPDVDPEDRQRAIEAEKESLDTGSKDESSDSTVDAVDDAEDTLAGGDATESSDEAAKGEDTVDASDGKEGADAEGAEAVSKASEKAAVETAAKPDKTVEAAQAGVQIDATPEALSEFYNRVVKTPLKANGKTIQINNAEEAIGLMQMGANYTRKMQELAPFRKAMTMLTKHNLLNEDELSFLIDIRNKNPDAIKKLIKDSGIDPMEIGDNDGKEYRLGNHRVSDNEVKFQEGLSSLKTTPEGQATLSEIHTNWDDASKDLLWDHPQIMSDIHIHRENGFYAKVTTEVARQKALGKIPADTPFLYAYKTVGDQLVAQSSDNGSSPKPGTQTTVDPVSKTIVASGRTPSAKPVVKNSDKAAAAASTKSTTKVASRPTNPLAMADDEFMKQFNNRL